MIKSNPFGLVVGDLEIERITLQNLSVRMRKRVEELELEFEVDH